MSLDQQPWVEKYRPRHLSDVVGQTEIVKRLKAFVNDKAMPHLMFAGPAGTGKTTCALALIRDMFQKNMKRNQSYLELNASDARGIDVIRTDVKDFAKTQPPTGVPFKILVLDEADSTTAAAQQALRRTMEKFTHNCRFILICNYSNKIILPIQSRTSMFRFSPLSKEELIDRINHVAKNEKLKIRPDGVDALIYVCGGDMRRAVNYLQACSTIGDEITEDVVYRITGKINPLEIQSLLKAAIAREFMVAKRKLDELFNSYGLSGRNIVKQCHSEVFNLDVSEKVKMDIIKMLAEIEFRLSQGATEEIQLNAMLAKIAIMDL
ncbi:Replication factor C small subunit [Candidatus Lokiarchaeum ossiferum]|uniref:Replication factor C small subunit n=1 Tax=Candidatus Lokiarchaeum ossiferum TaxID=2951803 RepID=A0ABY6HT00_9ARCH|nr:Replication factor C small subunit [Candidatus Lokiarchaeum sp. B-35]